MRGELNARIGRSMPSPLYGVLVAEPDRAADGAGALVAQWRAVRPVVALLGGLLLAL